MSKPIDPSIARIIVEGKDDVHVIVHVLMKHGIKAHAFEKQPNDKSFQPEVVIRLADSTPTDEAGEKSRAVKSFSLACKAPLGPRALVVDADGHGTDKGQLWGRTATWAAIRSALGSGGENPHEAALKLPTEPPESGFIGIHASRGMPIGVWIMPNNMDKGTLEDFCRAMIDDGNTLIDFAEECTDRAKREKSAPFKDKDRMKSVLGTWLAWQESPNLELGQAVKAQRFDANKALAVQFVSWVKNWLASLPRRSDD